MINPAGPVGVTATCTLTDADIELGEKIALTRIQRAETHALKDRQLADPHIHHDVRVAHYRGSWAEIAAARYLDVPLPADQAHRFHNQPDLDPDIEVRWNGYGRLIIRDHDRVEGRFVLVTGEPPTLALPGWIAGDELEWDWRGKPGGKPAWIVPVGALRPMPQLRDMIHPQR